MNTKYEPSLSTGSSEDSEFALSLKDLLQVIWRRLWMIGLTITVVVGTTIGYSLTQTPLYEASIKLLVGQAQRDENDQLSSEVQGLQLLTETMAEAVSTRPVAEAVIQELNLRISQEDFLEENLSVEQVGTTTFIEVSYEDPNPERAQQVANTIGEVFSRRVSEVSPSANAITATVWERAAVPDDPVSPNILLNMLVALVTGTMLGVGLAFLLEYLDDSWRSPEEVEQISGVPTFGVIPEFRLPKGKERRKDKVVLPPE